MHAPLHLLLAWLVALTLQAPLAAWGQGESDSQWNHFGVNYRLGFNIKAKFNNVGAAVFEPAPSTAGAVDHTYADGFVNVDSSGNRGGLTWNWGYQSTSQIGKEALLMHTFSTEGASSTANDNPLQGFEANYARDLAHFGFGRFGLKLALGFTDAKISQAQSLKGNINVLTDAYSLGGITPPLAPYAGSFTGPGPVIGDTPSRTMSTVSDGALISGNRQVHAWVYDLRFGPYFELPLFQRLTFQMGAGLAAGLVDSTFSFSDSTITSGRLVQAAGRARSTDSLAGFFAEAGMAYRFLPDASFFAGGQFEYLGEARQNVGVRGAELDLRRSLFLVAGVQLHF